LSLQRKELSNYYRTQLFYKVLAELHISNPQDHHQAGI